MSDAAETMKAEEITDKIEAAASPATPAEEESDIALDANDVIKTHVIASMAAGLLPIPGVDMAANVGIQVRMVHQICGLYGVTLRQNAARATVLSLVGGLLPATLAAGFVSGLKIIPGFGTLTGAAGASVLGGAMTYAVGRVFQSHLDTHESLVDFDPTKARAAMRREFDQGVTFARSLRQKVTSKITPKPKPDQTPEEMIRAEESQAAAAHGGMEPAAA